MNNLNSILVEGHLVQDPKLIHLENTKSNVCSLRIANNRFYKKNGETVHETYFFNIDAWGNTAENCAKYLKKGSGIRVVGKLKQERWKDEENNPHQNIKIVAEHIDFFPQKTKSKKDNPSSESQSNDPETVSAIELHPDVLTPLSEKDKKEVINI